MINRTRKAHRFWLEFLIAMTEKEIKARYKHAVLGFLWVILNPLLQMLVIGFVFQFFVPVKVDNYFLFLFAGLLPWNFFAMSLGKCTPAIVFERSLVQKAKFPREAIVLSIVLSNLFHFCVSLGLLLMVLVADKVLFDRYSVFETIQYVLRLTLVVPLIMWLTYFTSGLSLLVSALNVKFRDVNFVVQALIPLWFYATPVVFTLSLLPSRLHGMFYLNPMTSLIELFHFILLRIPVTNGEVLTVSLAISSLIPVAGWYFFIHESKYFDDWL